MLPAADEGRRVNEACFLSCSTLPLQSLTAGCGGFEILSILNPLEWGILWSGLDASEVDFSFPTRREESGRRSTRLNV